MKKRAFRTVLAFAFTLCLLAGITGAYAMEDVSGADYLAMRPVMDLVASAAISASDFPTVVSDEMSTLDQNFVTFFFSNGLKASLLGITDATLSDVALQEQLLKSVFSAKLPALDAITPVETSDDYTGFLPVKRETADNGDVYLIGEVYRGSMPIGQMSAVEYPTLAWEDRAIYTLSADDTALGGYRVDGFSVGSELLMEMQLQDYTNAILMEYINTKLGFSILYPSLFTDQYVIESADGASAALPDGSASFLIKRMDNASNATLDEYAWEMAAVAGDARVNINEMFSQVTIAYETEAGNSVFTVYVVTDDYIYMAQLAYPTNQSVIYSMYTEYLENSFVVNEVSVG
ncbi:MAG: hypothetical protein JW811_07370 [Clostridiales bacterium]|nr:hypothetical protein [Clostridiales bacterium]